MLDNCIATLHCHLQLFSPNQPPQNLKAYMDGHSYTHTDPLPCLEGDKQRHKVVTHPIILSGGIYIVGVCVGPSSFTNKTPCGARKVESEEKELVTSSPCGSSFPSVSIDQILIRPQKTESITMIRMYVYIHFFLSLEFYITCFFFKCFM